MPRRAPVQHPAKERGHVPEPTPTPPTSTVAHASPHVSPVGDLPSVSVADGAYLIDGTRYDRVTSILKDGVPTPALGFWFRKVVAEQAVEHADFLPELIAKSGKDGAVKWLKDSTLRQRDEAGNRGTHLHRIAESHVLGTPLDAETDERIGTDPALASMRAHALDLVETVTEPKDWEQIEAIVYHDEHRYAGTLDAIVRIHDPAVCAMFGRDPEEGARVVADWKTSRGVYDSHALQCAAYRHANHLLDQQKGRVVAQTPDDTDGAVIFHVRPEGWRIVMVATDLAVFDVFTSAIGVAKWERMKRDVVGSVPILTGRG